MSPAFDAKTDRFVALDAHRPGRLVFLSPEGDILLEKDIKGDVKRAVEEIFNVHVVKVNTLNVKAKPKRQRYVAGKTRTWKKAMVTLAPGDTIELFAS